ncbi:MAG: 4-hydroxy-3-methylbut-2-enyl diphosphate reductase, partial [Blautia sp.]|nr:4-hydroxy-3-methylbut-2-enyl diphosphate reductase [Blautia sp.]
GDLAKKGVQVCSEEELDTLPKGTVIIRSHGVGAATDEKVLSAGFRCVDATCPFVLKIHKIGEEQGKKGRHVIIIGDKTHPEVVGICGCTAGPYTVINSIEEANALSMDFPGGYTVVSQTTYQLHKFKELVDILKRKLYDREVLKTPISCEFFSTICNATEERQTEARKIAAMVDTMLVIGDKRSSNTQKLFEICKEECENTYYINTPVDLDSDMFQCSSYVGITAGASTPRKIIEEVHTHVRKNF